MTQPHGMSKTLRKKRQEHKNTENEGLNNSVLTSIKKRLPENFSPADL